MSQVFQAPGDTLELTAPSGGVLAGTAYKIGQLLVVAKVSVAQTLPFSADVKGVFYLPKTTGAAWTEGELLYWNNSTHKLITTGSGNLLVGVASAAAASGDAFGYCRLNGAARPDES